MPRIRYVLPFVLWSISARWQASSLITPPPRHGPGSNNRLSPYQLRHNNNNIPWSRFRLGTSSRILPIAVSVHSHGDGSAIAHRESSAIHHSNGSIKPSSSLVNGKDTATAAEHKNNKRNSKSKSAPTDADPAYSVLPRHIAFICDGNSRWASQHSLPESMGHVAGADRVVKLIETLYRLQLPSTSKTEDHSQTKQTAAAAAEATASPTRQPQSNPPNSPQNQKQNQKQQKRIEYCTLFAFSTENWSRPPHEISALFQLVERTANQYRQHEAITKGKLQIELLGNMDDDRIPNGARTELLLLQEESRLACDARRRSRRRKDTTVEEEGGDGVKNNDVVDYDDDDDDDDILTICLAINYGGRADILQATQKILQSILEGEVPPETLTDNNNTATEDYERLLSQNLWTSPLPDPDLIIRTGGEYRLSNFLLWNAAYAELFFSEVLWPDFDGEALGEALAWYGGRVRRFGGR